VATLTHCSMHSSEFTVLCALWLCGERVHKQIQDAVKTSRSSLDKARLARKLALWHALPNAYVCDRSAQP